MSLAGSVWAFKPLSRRQPMFYVATVPAANVDTHPDRSRTVERFFAAIQAGDSAELQEVLTPDAVTRWPQSGERITGAQACIQVYGNYPGGSPKYRVHRITGAGSIWVAELQAEYGDERWYIVSVIEFEASHIARMTDYFGPALPAPAWRQKWVQLEDPAR
jgi:hypothetical protein